jgi:hypothetical protein
MRTPSLLALVAVSLVGCHAVEDVEPGPKDCREDRCESAGSRDELLASLVGFNDPIAQFLRSAATERGTVAGNYRDIVDAVGTSIGCDASTERSFVVLSNQGYLPKPILTRCSDDAGAGSQFFVALAGTPEGLDPQTVHMTAWDTDAGVYRRYATAPSRSGETPGEMTVNVTPEFCLGCHGGPQHLTTWTPLMNEMTSPWAGWNATPGFSSELYDEFLDPAFAADPTFQEVTRDGLLTSAASFEPLVRTGVARVTGARLKQRAAAPDVDHALELLRPLYCDESINYVSEVHDSGELRTHALVDDALRSLFRSAGVDGSWSWLVDTRIHLMVPTGQEAPITQIPVRGESTIQVELGLVSRGVLDPRDALRVRALDWKHPVQSELRCGLFREASDRIHAGALDAAISTRAATTTAELVPLVFDEVMTLSVNGERTSLRPAPGAAYDLLQIPDASDPAALAAFRSGAWTGFQSTLGALGAAIDAHVTSYQAGAMRPVLVHERDRRACLAVAQNPTAPIFSDVDCP